MSPWLSKWFSSQQVSKGGAIRRSRQSVDRHSSIAEVRAETEIRGFHVFESGSHVVVICNPGFFRIHC